MIDPATLILAFSLATPTMLIGRTSLSSRAGTEVSNDLDLSNSSEYFAPLFISKPDTEVALEGSGLLGQSRLIATINSFAGLRDGWDGEDAVEPPLENVLACLKVARELPQQLPEPRAMISKGGEPSLYWDHAGSYAQLTFESNHTATYFELRATGVETFIDSLPVGTITPDWISEKVRGLEQVALTA